MFSLGSMMGMMGGAPTIPSGDVIINKLKAAKTMQMGDTSDAQIKSLVDGLKSLLQNPMQSKGGGAKAKAQQGSERLSVQGIGDSTRNAIDSSLIPLINSVMAEADKIVGRDDGGTGLLDTISVIQSLSGLSGFDPRFSEASILKPANSDAEMDLVAATVDRVSFNVAQGIQSDSSGAQEIQGLVEILSKLLYDAQDARQTAESYSVYLASVSAAGALLSMGSPEWKAVMEKAFSTEDADKIKAANEEFLRVDDE